MLLSMSGATAFAHDIEVMNDDGVTIYYVWTNNNKELAVSFIGDSYSNYSNEYSGIVRIPASVTYNGSTYSVTSVNEDGVVDVADIACIIDKMCVYEMLDD